MSSVDIVNNWRNVAKSWSSLLKTSVQTKLISVFIHLKSSILCNATICHINAHTYSCSYRKQKFKQQLLQSHWNIRELSVDKAITAVAGKEWKIQLVVDNVFFQLSHPFSQSRKHKQWKETTSDNFETSWQ